MKYIGRRFFSALLTIVMVSSIFCGSASAAVQSSEYLNAYSATVTPKGKGVIVVTIDVIGVGRMTEIGAETIYIYESADGKSFSRVATYESDDYPVLMGSGTFYCKDVVTYQGKAGYYYYASVYVYAANDKGSDTGHYSTSIKRAT